jgi:muramoyltetrapeptide carboxypeptidase
MSIKKPECLKKGDKVGLISVSSPVKREVVDRSVKYLEKLGFSIELSKHIFDDIGYMAGTAEDRAQDLNEMFENDDIKAIFVAYGGTSANQMLPYIDYDLINKKPKIFVGLSDSSILNLAIYSKSNIVTFHGPTGYNFGESGMTKYTEKYFLKVLFDPNPLGEIEELSKWITIREGRAEGEIIGANLTLLQSLIGTPYEPNWNDKILFWEDLFVEYHTIDLILTHLRLAGVFDKIKGMIIGKLVECEEKEYTMKETFEDMILRLTKGYNFPILYNVDLGHTDDKITIPIGVKTKLEITSDAKKLIFTESATIPKRRDV